MLERQTNKRSTVSGIRADYLLERGMWRATCRQCGWQVHNAVRRQAAAQFRWHVRDDHGPAYGATLEATAG